MAFLGRSVRACAHRWGVGLSQRRLAASHMGGSFSEAFSAALEIRVSSAWRTLFARSAFAAKAAELQRAFVAAVERFFD